MLPPLDTKGRRGRKHDPLYQARLTLHTGAGLLTAKQQTRLENLFADEDHAPVQATWGVYQQLVTAYREPDRRLGKFVMQTVINALTSGVPIPLVEARRLGRTLKQRANDILADIARQPLIHGTNLGSESLQLVDGHGTNLEERSG